MWEIQLDKTITGKSKEDHTQPGENILVLQFMAKAV
jgi:hypothetical protein